MDPDIDEVGVAGSVQANDASFRGIAGIELSRIKKPAAFRNA
jgi:hypothetical protein